MKQLTIASSLVALLVGGSALAQTAQPDNAAAQDYCADGFVASSAPQSGAMTKEQTGQMADREFTAMDRNSDGRVSFAEFSTCMSRAASGLRPATGTNGRSTQSDAAFNTADANNDGKLNSQEYLSAAEREFGQQSAASSPDAVPVYFIWVPASAVAEPSHSGAPGAATTANATAGSTQSGANGAATPENQAAAHAAMGFDNQDGNGDGAVTKAEWQAGNSGISPDLVELHFKLLDANGDNAITKEEYAAKWTARFNQAQQAQGSAAQGESVPVWVLYVY